MVAGSTPFASPLAGIGLPKRAVANAIHAASITTAGNAARHDQRRSISARPDTTASTARPSGRVSAASAPRVSGSKRRPSSAAHSAPTISAM